MVAALGIAASLLSDVGFKALKSLTSGKTTTGTTQAGITDQTAATGQNVPASGFGSGRGDVAKIFAKIDSDGNGSISKDEFMAFKQQVDSTLSALLKTQEQASGATGTTAAGKGKFDGLFSKLDGNGDGSLSKDELQSVMSHRHHRHAAADPSTTANATSASGASSNGDSASQDGGGSPTSFLSALLDLQSSSSATAG